MTKKPAKPAKRPRKLRSAGTGQYIKKGAKATTVSEPRPIWTGYAFFGDEGSWERGPPVLYSSLEQAKYFEHLYSSPAEKVSLYLRKGRAKK